MVDEGTGGGTGLRRSKAGGEGEQECGEARRQILEPQLVLRQLARLADGGRLVAITGANFSQRALKAAAALLEDGGLEAHRSARYAGWDKPEAKAMLGSDLASIEALKTTVGRISRAGVYPLCLTLDSVGPITRTVEDAALALHDRVLQEPGFTDASHRAEVAAVLALPLADRAASHPADSAPSGESPTNTVENRPLNKPPLSQSPALAQIASAYPTAGGLYHWASILGGRGYGWVCAWINLLGLIFVVASVNVGTYLLFKDLVVTGVFGADTSGWGLPHQVIAVSLIAAIDAGR